MVMSRNYLRPSRGVVASGQTTVGDGEPSSTASSDASTVARGWASVRGMPDLDFEQRLSPDAVLREFQRSQSITADGRFDPRSRDALIRVLGQRWRAIPNADSLIASARSLTNGQTLPLNLWKVVATVGLTEMDMLDSPSDLDVTAGAPRFTSSSTTQPTPVFTREDDAASNQCRGTPDQCAAARELWNHIMTTRGAQRDRSLITRMQREMGGDIRADGLFGRETADRIFALTGLVIRGSTTGFPDQSRPGGTGTSTTGGTGTGGPGTGGTGTGGADIARMAASSFTTADHIAAFFERNKIAIIASGSVLLAGGIAAIYLSTRDDI